MFRNLTAYMSAAAVACAGFTAAPARADDNDLLKLLAGAAVIGIIAHEARKDRKRREARHPAPPPPPAPVISYTLPGQCLTTLRDGQGWKGYYFKSCTDGILRSQLPAECLREVSTQSGIRLAYAEPCLLNRGYKIENGWR